MGPSHAKSLVAHEMTGPESGHSWSTSAWNWHLCVLRRYCMCVVIFPLIICYAIGGSCSRSEGCGETIQKLHDTQTCIYFVIRAAATSEPWKKEGRRGCFPRLIAASSDPNRRDQAKNIPTQRPICICGINALFFLFFCRLGEGCAGGQNKNAGAHIIDASSLRSRRSRNIIDGKASMAMRIKDPRVGRTYFHSLSASPARQILLTS